MTDPAILSRETNARMWAQSHHKPNVPLDMSNPEDARMAPIWLHIFEKVRAEDDAGRLVITYNHPVVVQSLAEAHIADQVAAEHLRSASAHHRGRHAWRGRHGRIGMEVGEPDAFVPNIDPKVTSPAASADPMVKQHVDAADAAAAVSVNKTQEAAAIQPPSVPPQVVAQIAAPTPPPRGGSAPDHVAHLKKRHIAVRHLEHILVRETDARFNAQLHFRPGRQLDPSNPIDQKMIPLWWDIYNKVEREQRDGRLRITYNHPVVAQNLLDAHVADQATVQNLDAAASAPDPATAQQHLDAAAIAQQIARDKTREAAAHQPPTASLDLARQAARAMPIPPPPLAPASEQLAHQQAQAAAGRAAGAYRGHGRGHEGRGRRGPGDHRRGEGPIPGANQPTPQAPGQSADAARSSSPGDAGGAGSTEDAASTTTTDEPKSRLKTVLIVGGVVGVGALIAKWIQGEVLANREIKDLASRGRAPSRPRNVEKTVITKPLPPLSFAPSFA